MEKNISAENLAAIENIKNAFLERKSQYDILCGEVLNCARQVKMWLAIAQVKGKFEAIKYESFWAWLQRHSLLRSIAIDSRKIHMHARGYIDSVIRDVLSKEQYGQLIKCSRLQDRLNKLEEIVGPLKDYRNKRYAHLENEELEQVSCDLQGLFVALANLDDSLSLILHFLLNPRLIVCNEWDFYKIDDVKAYGATCSLERYFQNDPTFQECQEIIEKLCGINEAECV
jgi:hypothetical protein